MKKSVEVDGATLWRQRRGPLGLAVGRHWDTHAVVGPSRHMSARTNEANTPSSWAKRLSGVSYSKMFPLFITITRSAVRMVWTRCCVDVRDADISYEFEHMDRNDRSEHFTDWSCMVASFYFGWTKKHPFLLLVNLLVYMPLNTNQHGGVLFSLS